MATVRLSNGSFTYQCGCIVQPVPSTRFDVSCKPSGRATQATRHSMPQPITPFCLHVLDGKASKGGVVVLASVQQQPVTMLSTADCSDAALCPAIDITTQAGPSSVQVGAMTIGLRYRCCSPRQAGDWTAFHRTCRPHSTRVTCILQR